MHRHTTPRLARARLVALSAILALSACDRAAPGEEPGDGTATTTAPVDGASPAPAPAGTSSTGGNSIPAALHGRWGLTGADCVTGPAAEGLLVIGPRSLEFYESAGTLREVEQSAPGSVRASFAFTGEGMSWERDMALALEGGGEALVRREYGQDAEQGPIRYTKC